jgi:2-polyprenyl-6-methoxyphenol hydroxylase-like FAD-dependent oxidoreductase
LVGVLHKHILDNYSEQIELNYGFEVQPLDFGAESGGPVYVRASKCGDGVAMLTSSVEKTALEQQESVLCDPNLGSSIFSADLLIAADGTVRTIANAIQEKDKKRFEAMNPVQRLFAGSPFKVKRYPDDNRRIYKTIPIKLPSDWRGDLNYSARSKGSRIVYDALPANKNNDYCGVMLLREDDPLAKPNSNPSELREALAESLPQFSAIIDDETLKKVALKPPSYLPSFRYISPRLNEGDKTLILGDCAHTVKPYFGLGANSALEDVKVRLQRVRSKSVD